MSITQNELDKIIGKEVTYIYGLEKYSESVKIAFEDGSQIEFWHSQCCCETVSLEDYEGDIVNGAVILSAEEVDGEANNPEYAESFTWTFYKINTTKGDLWMRWLGQSNGWYSESVDVSYTEGES